MMYKIIYTILMSDIVGLFLFIQLYLAKYEENRLEESQERVRIAINSMNNLTMEYRERGYKKAMEAFAQYEQKLDEEKPKRQTKRRRKRNKNKEKK